MKFFKIRKLKYLLAVFGRPESLSASKTGGNLKLFKIRNQDEYLEHIAKSSEYLAEIQRTEKLLTPVNGRDRFKVRGYSYTAGREVDFQVGYEHSHGDGSVNWREHLTCPMTALNNRMRAAIHIFDSEAAAHQSDRIYISEQATPLHRHFAARYDTVAGSEYLMNQCPLGASDHRGIRNENLANLTFQNGSFERVISLDCFEHFPDYQLAFRECARILAPQGKMLWSVPFDPEFANNLMRARINKNGNIEHIHEPEYHYNPLTTNGCLCFTHFGWEMLDQVRSAGFSDAYAVMFWSAAFGYLGGEQLIFIATK